LELLCDSSTGVLRPLVPHRYTSIYRIDNLVTAFTRTTVGTASIDCQIHLVADVGIFEMLPLEGEKERKKVLREMVGCLVFKLVTVALPINTNPYNHNPPMEHS
jgi:hypothetical protein